MYLLRQRKHEARLLKMTASLDSCAWQMLWTVENGES